MRPTRIALALPETGSQFIPDMLSRATDKEFLPIYLSFNDATTLFQTHRDIPSIESIESSLYLTRAKTRLVPF